MRAAAALMMAVFAVLENVNEGLALLVRSYSGE
jgi:hypothetical protein